MDRSRAPGERDRRPTASLSDERLRVCLERSIELDNVRLRLRDWPGRAGPLVHVPDPLSPGDSAVDDLAAALAPRYRVVSVSSRGDVAYQVDALDLVGVLGQFGFRTPVLVGERLGCVTALVAAAWYPGRVAGLILVEPVFEPPRSERLAARALRECPPDVARLRAGVRCPVLERASPRNLDETARSAVEAFLAATLP